MKRLLITGILFAMFSLNFIIPSPTKKSDTSTSPSSTNAVITEKESFTDIAWNPKKKFERLATPVVPKLGTSLFSILTSYTYPTVIEQITPLTLAQLDAAQIPDLRRKVSRAIIELIQEIDGLQKQHEKNVPKLLEVVDPKMKQLATFGHKAQELTLLDDELEDQVPAWIAQFDSFISKFDNANLTIAENLRKDTINLLKDFGFTNDRKRAIETLRGLSPEAIKTNGPTIVAKMNDFLATVVTHLHNKKEEAPDLVNDIYTIIQVSGDKNITLGRDELNNARKTLDHYKRKVIAYQLKKNIKQTLKHAKQIQDTELLTRETTQKTYNNSTLSPLDELGGTFNTDHESSTWLTDIAHLLKKADESSDTEE